MKPSEKQTKKILIRIYTSMFSFSLFHSSRGSKVESGIRFLKITGILDFAFLILSRLEIIIKTKFVGGMIQYKSCLFHYYYIYIEKTR